MINSKSEKYQTNKDLLQNKPYIQNMMIFVPNMSKPTKRNNGYVAKVLILFGAKIACYGLRGYFARGLNYSIVLATIKLPLTKAEFLIFAHVTLTGHFPIGTNFSTVHVQLTIPNSLATLGIRPESLLAISL